MDSSDQRISLEDLKRRAAQQRLQGGQSQQNSKNHQTKQHQSQQNQQQSPMNFTLERCQGGPHDSRKDTIQYQLRREEPNLHHRSRNSRPRHNKKNQSKGKSGNGGNLFSSQNVPPLRVEPQSHRQAKGKGHHPHQHNPRYNQRAQSADQAYQPQSIINQRNYSAPHGANYHAAQPGLVPMTVQELKALTKQRQMRELELKNGQSSAPYQTHITQNPPHQPNLTDERRSQGVSQVERVKHHLHQANLQLQRHYPDSFEPNQEHPHYQLQPVHHKNQNSRNSASSSRGSPSHVDWNYDYEDTTSSSMREKVRSAPEPRHLYGNDFDIPPHFEPRRASRSISNPVPYLLQESDEEDGDLEHSSFRESTESGSVEEFRHSGGSVGSGFSASSGRNSFQPPDDRTSATALELQHVQRQLQLAQLQLQNASLHEREPSEHPPILQRHHVTQVHHHRQQAPPQPQPQRSPEQTQPYHSPPQRTSPPPPPLPFGVFGQSYSMRQASESEWSQNAFCEKSISAPEVIHYHADPVLVAARSISSPEMDSELSMQRFSAFSSNSSDFASMLLPPNATQYSSLSSNRNSSNPGSLFSTSDLSTNPIEQQRLMYQRSRPASLNASLNAMSTVIDTTGSHSSNSTHSADVGGSGGAMNVRSNSYEEDDGEIGDDVPEWMDDNSPYDENALGEVESSSSKPGIATDLSDAVALDKDGNLIKTRSPTEPPIPAAYMSQASTNTQSSSGSSSSEAVSGGGAESQGVGQNPKRLGVTGRSGGSGEISQSVAEFALLSPHEQKQQLDAEQRRRYFFSSQSTSSVANHQEQQTAIVEEVEQEESFFDKSMLDDQLDDHQDDLAQDGLKTDSEKDEAETETDTFFPEFKQSSLSSESKVSATSSRSDDPPMSPIEANSRLAFWSASLSFEE